LATNTKMATKSRGPSWVPLLSLLPFATAKFLWSTIPANSSDIIRTAYPLGNGRLGALHHGGPLAETLTLNIDTLWSGGPFQVSNYTGGNPSSSVSGNLTCIRDWIFTNGTGNVTDLLGDDRFYGSYRVLGNLSITIPSLVGGNASVEGYRRSLDLAEGVHTTAFSVDGQNIETSAFCSFPDQVCVYAVQASRGLPALEVRLDNELVEAGLQNVTCFDGQGYGNETAHVRLRGVTQLGPPEGMRYDSTARVVSGSSVQTTFNNGTLEVIPGDGTTSVTIVVGAGTNYDPKKGTAEFGYSFKGEDPGPTVEATTRAAAAKTLDALNKAHVEDFTSLTGRFSLSLPDPYNSTDTPTSELIARYNSDDTAGDPFLESLLFDYANYLFVSASRPGSLPPNLQGRWSEGLDASWSADYHANINLQMNHVSASKASRRNDKQCS
jgi:alpha-L-fucosidase 2